MPHADLDERRAYKRQWYARNRIKMLAYQRAWTRDNPERAKTMSRRKLLKRGYGMTLGEYDEMFGAQGGLCLICGKPETSRSGRGPENLKSLAVDHNHVTGKVRGLLCIRCNRAMGMFEDDPDLLRKAASYVHERDSTSLP